VTGVDLVSDELSIDTGSGGSAHRVSPPALAGTGSGGIGLCCATSPRSTPGPGRDIAIRAASLGAEVGQTSAATSERISVADHPAAGITW
jgi:hypothetical protein